MDVARAFREALFQGLTAGCYVRFFAPRDERSSFAGLDSGRGFLRLKPCWRSQQRRKLATYSASACQGSSEHDPMSTPGSEYRIRGSRPFCGESGRKEQKQDQFIPRGLPIVN